MIELVPQILCASAARYAERPAIVMDQRIITYAELEAESNQFARSLISHGIARGARVALWLPKSIEAMVAIYGIMKAGAAYVPIDPAAPEARMGFIAGDCGVEGLVTLQDRADAAIKELAGKAPLKAVWYADVNGNEIPPSGAVPSVTWNSLKGEDPEPFNCPAHRDDLAYILYTSGSTGQPKGVMLSHANALSFVNWAADIFAISKDDRLANHAPFHFDLSVFDLYVAARAGATVYPVSSRTAGFPAAVARQLSQQKLTICYATPSTLISLLTRGGLASLDLSALRVVLFAGEVFPVKYLRALMALAPQARFANLYGPTETNVCTWYEVFSPPDGNEPIPIGQACSNCEVFILDETLSIVPDGCSGELWVSGGTVMQGYWRRPEMTDRLLKTIQPKPGVKVRAYNTGDLVRRRADGNLEFIGRRDHQVKTRGYRVELGEIEAVLNSHPSVDEAVVVPLADDTIGHRLAAVVVIKQHAEVGKSQLLQHCADSLPRYMIPDVMMFQPALPRTSSGKVDRRAVAAWLEHHSQDLTREDVCQQS